MSAQFDPVPELQRLLGPAVFIAWPKGVKGNNTVPWGHLRLKHMTPDYLATLKDGNIGVVLGEASLGLCAVDGDRDDFVADFLNDNPHLASTLSTHGNRGRVFWLRFDGDYPKKSNKLKTHSGEDLGEFRSNGNQSIISGIHPDTLKAYTFVQRQPAATIAFSSIKWPDSIANPPTLQRDRDSEAISVTSVPLSLCLSVKSVAQAVEISLPDRVHTNDRCLFMLARALLSVEIAAGPLNRAQRMDAFSQWYAKANARGALRPGQSKDEYLVEFMNACKKAKFALGVNPIDQAWKLSETEPLPAESAQFDSSDGKRIVALCYQLHLLHNGGVWFLPTRALGKLINRTHTTAATWLTALVEMGIIEVASKPGMNLSTRHRYVTHTQP